MKQLITLLATAIFCTSVGAQTDSSRHPGSDTIRIGGIIIVKHGKTNGSNDNNTSKHFNQKKINSNVSTNWWIIDLGFSNYSDKTNYSAATADQYLVNKPGSTLPLGISDFKVKTGKSINVNIWVFMQRVNLIRHYVNLKYGLGVELNNYRYNADLSYKKSGTSPYPSISPIPHAYVIRDSISFSKNKLAADYLTIPLMINFITNPSHPKKGLNLSAGLSAGYLYSQRNKQKSSERGKQYNKGDYDLNRFKLSYIGDLGFGPLHLYGSYSPRSFYEKSLDMRPYTVGIRFSNW